MTTPRALGLALLLALAAPPARAQTLGARLDHLDGSADELAGLEALEQGRFVAAREIAERVLRQQPDSFAGHFLLGSALRQGEGDLPRARYQLEQALAAYERRWPMEGVLAALVPAGRAPWRWHQGTLRELALVLGALDRPEEQLRIIDKHNRLYTPPWQAQRIWPLMKLRRYDEARAAARAAMASDLPGARKYARADLCGAEAESGDRQRAYQACVEATADFRDPASPQGQLEFSNASDAALEVFRFDEAERFIVEATRRHNTVLWVNPFQQAAELFLSEGRMAEAIAALRGGQELRIARPAWVDQFDRARFDGTLARLFLLAGLSDRAVAAAARALYSPDRQGHASGTEQQADSAAALLLSVALAERAERTAEEAVIAPFLSSLRLRARALWERLLSWRARRRAAVALAGEDFLVRSLRPYYLGMLLPPWQLPEAVDAVGGGVALAGLERARAREAHPVAQRYFRALEAEAEWARGRCPAAGAAAAEAAGGLPQAEALLRARMEAIQGACAREQGDRAAMATHLLKVLAVDPGLLRRMGLSLPVAIEPDGSALAARAAALLARSPRFDDEGGPFHLTLAGGTQARACLLGPSREQLACATVNLPVDSGPEAGARLLLGELHLAAFAVHTDLSQADLSSLDGSPTAGRADRQVQSVLDKLGE